MDFRRCFHLVLDSEQITPGMRTAVAALARRYGTTFIGSYAGENVSRIRAPTTRRDAIAKAVALTLDVVLLKEQWPVLGENGLTYSLSRGPDGRLLIEDHEARWADSPEGGLEVGLTFATPGDCLANLGVPATPGLIVTYMDRLHLLIRAERVFE